MDREHPWIHCPVQCGKFDAIQSSKALNLNVAVGMQNQLAKL